MNRIQDCGEIVDMPVFPYMATKSPVDFASFVIYCRCQNMTIVTVNAFPANY